MSKWYLMITLKNKKQSSQRHKKMMKIMFHLFSCFTSVFFATGKHLWKGNLSRYEGNTGLPCATVFSEQIYEQKLTRAGCQEPIGFRIMNLLFLNCARQKEIENDFPFLLLRLTYSGFVLYSSLLNSHEFSRDTRGKKWNVHAAQIPTSPDKHKISWCV